MTRPSAVVRGRVLTLPVASRVGACLDALPAQVIGAIRRVHPRASILATLSDERTRGPRILTVSGRRQRSRQQWRRMIATILDTADAVADWEKALVLVAASNAPE